MKGFYSICLILSVSLNISGQLRKNTIDSYTSIKTDSVGYNHTIITVDKGIEENYYKHLVYNSKNPEVLGYRIRIYSGSGIDAKQQANRVRSLFLSKYPEIGADLQYDAPDYKVYVGDCRTRSEVLKLFNQIKRDFPYAFIPPRQAIDYEKYKRSIADD